MLVTVAICTRNRCDALERTLRSLAAVVVPAGLSWEILVVDNGSSDETMGTIAKLATALPVRALVEPRVGLSHARNAAVAAARGEYILWIDDDVLVDSQWLAAYHDAFSEWPHAAFFGGPIVPLFEGDPPPWLTRALPHVGNAYAAIDLGSAPVALNESTLPFGANLVVRMAEQRQCAYDPALGRRDTLMYAGEEWAVLQELLRRGASGRWVPAARIRHVIPAARQSVRYLRRYYTGNGFSLSRHRHVPGEKTLFGRPRWAWREAVTQELAYRVRRLYAPSDVWSPHLKRASIAWGLVRTPRTPANLS